MARIAILGAGALGTALSIALHKRERTIYLWTVESDVVEAIKETHQNSKYLPGALVPPAVHPTLDMAQALQDAEVVVMAVPSFAVKEVAQLTIAHLPDSAIIVSASRGLEEESLRRMSEVIQAELPPDLQLPVAAMSGPYLAPELAQGSTAGVDLACESLSSARQVRQLLSTPKFKLKPTNDIAGVEAGATFNTVFAVGAGIGDGLGWGMNERATYLTKSLAEISRLAAALGGKRPTLYGLSGLGDLTVTAFSPHSRNRTLGEELTRGRGLRDIVSGMVSVVEGVAASKAAHSIAAEHHIRLSITEALYQIVHEGEEPKLLQKALLASR
jgi:glycerol-3-phosphate dehydrogenase (NAD(P)+)